MNLIITEKHERHVQMTESLYKLSSYLLRGSRPACEVAFINIIELLRENISCLKFLPSRNKFYDISLS